MTQIFLNQVPRTFDPVPATWGELLEKLDASAAGEDRLLSAARFDGVDEPAFREPTLTDRLLADVARIEVETAAPGAFLRTCLLETLGPLQEVAGRAQGLASLYRRDDVSDGHQALKDLAGELGQLATLIDLLTGPLGLDLGHADDLGTALDTLVAAQASEDWMTVADVLEYELEPAIRRWVSRLTQLTHQLQ